MTRLTIAGTALRLLCLPTALGMLTACEHRQAAVAKRPEVNPQGDLNEVHQLLAAAKSNPSFQPGSREAGPPIHVDPYPHSAGMAHMAMMNAAQQSASHLDG